MPMVLTIFYYSLLDSSLPLSFATIRLMVPWPKEKTHILAPIRPFQEMVFDL